MNAATAQRHILIGQLNDLDAELVSRPVHEHRPQATDIVVTAPRLSPHSFLLLRRLEGRLRMRMKDLHGHVVTVFVFADDAHVVFLGERPI